jgi:hypothetical protein
MKIHQLFEAQELSVSLEAKVSAALKAAVKEFKVPDIGTFDSAPYPGHGGMFKVDVFTRSDALDPAEIADLHDDPEVRKALKKKIEASRSKRVQTIVDARKKIFKKVFDFAVANGLAEVGIGTGRKTYVKPSEANLDDIDFSASEIRFSLMFPNEIRGKAFNLAQERENVFKLLSKDTELKKKYIVDNGYNGPIILLNQTELKKFIKAHKEQVDSDIERYIKAEVDDYRLGQYGSRSAAEFARNTRQLYDYTKISNKNLSSLQCLTQYLVIETLGKEILRDLNAALQRIDHLTPAKLGAKLEEKRLIWLRHHDHTLARVTVGKPKFAKENYKGE